MAINILIAIAAVVLEAGAIFLVTLWQGSHDGWFLLEGAALHAGVSILFGLLALKAISLRDNKTRPPMISLNFCLLFLFPVLAPLGFLLVIMVRRWLIDRQRSRRISLLTMPAYELQRGHYDCSRRAGAMHAQLLDESAPLSVRMKALLAIQSMPARYSSAALRNVLNDRVDDLRLLAHGILESKEKELAAGIHDALHRYRQFGADDFPEEHYAACQQLAELYWELVYQDLVQGDVRRFALRRANFFAMEGLKWYERSAGLRVICAHTLRVGGDYRRAEAAYSVAITCGFPAVRLEPYLAELAFLRHDYPTVRELMRHTSAQIGVPLPELHQSAAYWG